MLVVLSMQMTIVGNVVFVVRADPRRCGAKCKTYERGPPNDFVTQTCSVNRATTFFVNTF